MVTITGRLMPQPEYWYSLKNGKILSFHITEKGVIFSSDSETWPSALAGQLDISYKFLRNCTRVVSVAYIVEMGIELA